MPLYRVKARWSGFSGAPGYTVMHFDSGTDANQAGAQNVYGVVYNFFTECMSALPSAVTITVEGAVEIIDIASGDLIDVISVTPSPGGKGLATGGFSSATGACLSWTTPGVRNGRRVKGRTFLVPLASSNYDQDGTLTAACMTDLNNAAATLYDVADFFSVYARPTGPDATDGQAYTVTGHRLTDKTAVLRSRRD